MKYVNMSNMCMLVWDIELHTKQIHVYSLFAVEIAETSFL